MICFSLAVPRKSVPWIGIGSRAAHLLDADVFFRPTFKQQHLNAQLRPNGNFHLSRALQLTAAKWD